MAYLGSRGVPAPKVYFFDSSARNSLGIEFTIQEYIQKSATLTSVLNVINSHAVSKLYILEAVKLQQTIWNAGGDFDQSGSLYCDWDSETKDYFVGPMVDPEFFAPLLEGSRFQYGPFGSWRDVVGAFISTREGRDWDACEDADGIRSRLPPCEVTGEQLRAKIREIDAMPDATPDLTFKPRLVHWDMHGENILVRVTDGADIEIAALIDWDAVVIEPAGICRSIMPACALEFQRDLDLARREFNLPAEWFSEKASAAKEYLTAHIPFFYLDKQVRVKKSK
ncbi:hypothetical protein QBC42DRAFT_188144 [Cladorrhinum samala]|uniref:Altered inheritance of mitochondria protein 9, mitochondrial n=1 Tax=Cladorrhinum samala TaxID=585594 RepID=A0AAV9HDK9_9PEZI|nr:hypothetical protein QBC42DRAFT_188144 [Cladorrhinum samala]